MSKYPELNKLFFSKTSDFLNLYLLRQEQKSKETIKAYRISLNEFFTYVTENAGKNVMNFCFTDCSYDFVLGYSQYLQEGKKLCNSTVNQRLAALKSYLKYVADGDISLVQVWRNEHWCLSPMWYTFCQPKELDGYYGIPQVTGVVGSLRKRIIMLHKPHPEDVMDKGAVKDLLKYLVEYGELG